MNPMELVEREQLRTDLPDFRVGDTVKVHVKMQGESGPLSPCERFRTELGWRGSFPLILQELIESM